MAVSLSLPLAGETDRTEGLVTRAFMWLLGIEFRISGTFQGQSSCDSRVCMVRGRMGNPGGAHGVTRDWSIPGDTVAAAVGWILKERVRGSCRLCLLSGVIRTDVWTETT